MEETKKNLGDRLVDQYKCSKASYEDAVRKRDQLVASEWEKDMHPQDRRVQAWQHPDVLQLMSIYDREAEALRLLQAEMIRANLARFQVSDLEVTAVLHPKLGVKSLPGVGDELRAPLSEICTLKYRGVAMRLGVDREQVHLHVEIRFGGVEIGHVDSDGDFHYCGAPTLREALAWKLATDGGQWRELNIDLDAWSGALLDLIAANGTGERFFKEEYQQLLKLIFVPEKTGRTGDSPYSAKTVLWRVATRQLGTPHDGYRVLY